MAHQLQDLTEDDVLALSAAAGDPAWLLQRRQEAYKAFADLEWPTNRDEEWRFTNPKRFDLSRPVLTAAGDAAPLDGGFVAKVGDAVAGAARMVDGRTVHAAVDGEVAARGVVVADLVQAAGQHADLVRAHLGTVVTAEEKFDAATLAAFTGGVLVYVPDDVEVEAPITITVQAHTDGTHVGRVLVVLGRFAKATVYLDQAGDAAATVCNAVEVVVGDGARATVVTGQDWGDHVDHVTRHRGRVGRDADYRHLEVTLGGRTTYVRPDVWLAGPGGSAELLGVYFATDRQQIEHRSLIFHDASHTTSAYVHKGALQGESRTTWFGNIRIAPDAKATASDETNRNLILSPGARADTIPFLEIETADVIACGHHSSVGQIDELQLFYLESRGIAREEAARMLVFAFFTEVLERFDRPEVADTVMAEIAAEITTGPATIFNPRRAAVS